MKKIKITKEMYKMLPSEILVEINAFSTVDDRKYAHVSHVYINPKDEEKLRKYAEREAKKVSKIKRKIDSMVGYEFLNYGPIAKDSVPEGFLLYDKEEAQKEFKKTLQ